MENFLVKYKPLEESFLFPRKSFSVWGWRNLQVRPCPWDVGNSVGVSRLGVHQGLAPLRQRGNIYSLGPGFSSAESVFMAAEVVYYIARGAV